MLSGRPVKCVNVLKCGLLGALACIVSVSSLPAQAWYPYAPWPGNYPVFPYQGFAPGFHGYGQRPPWPGYYPARPMGVNPWYRTFNYQRPWGSIRGHITADGNFWVNINIGGNYQDLQYLLTFMQMSANVDMGQGFRPAIPGAESIPDDPWSM